MTDVTEAPPEPVEAPRAGATGRPTGLLVACALAVVFFASTVLLAIVAAGLKSDKDALRADTANVAEASGRFVDTLLAYDYRDPEAYRERVLALTAPPFSEQFEEAVDGLEQGFTAAQQVSVGTVQDVFVAEVGDEGTATAIVVYDRTLDGTAGTRQERNLYVRLDLVERDDGWRVNNVVNLNLAFSDAGAGAGSTTTTTG